MLQRWSEEEHEAFVAGVKEFGKDYGKIAEFIPTKSRLQVKSHAFQIRNLDEFTKSKFTKDKSPEDIKFLFEQLEKELPQVPVTKYKKKEPKNPTRHQTFWTKEDYDTLITGIKKHGIDDYHKLWKPLRDKFEKKDIGRKIREHRDLWEKRNIGKVTWRAIRS